MIELGDEVKHVVTGCKGICVAITVWLHGCRRMNVQQQMKKGGSVPDMIAFDELELVLVRKGVVPFTPFNPPQVEQPPVRKDKGGPRPVGGKFRC